MCYPKPGPRCSSHAKKALDKATKKLNEAKSSGDSAATQTARSAHDQAKWDYYTTPQGQIFLKKKIDAKAEDDPEGAAELETIRARAQAYHEEQKAKYLSMQDSVVSPPSEELEIALRTMDMEGDFPPETEIMLREYEKRYGPPQIGRTRAVFDRKDGTVIKVPFAWEGAYANGNENRQYKANQEQEDVFIPMAKCSWHHDEGLDPEDQTSSLVMEKVEPLERVRYNELPGWVGYVDGGQVGMTKDGRLVAYDL